LHPNVLSVNSTDHDLRTFQLRSWAETRIVAFFADNLGR